MCAGEVFELLLSGDGVVDVLEVLEIDESMDVVFGSVRARTIFAVNSDSLPEAVCHPDVEVSGVT